MLTSVPPPTGELMSTRWAIRPTSGSPRPRPGESCRGAIPPPEPPAIPWPVNEFLLVCSHRSNPGRYEILARQCSRG